MQELVNILKRHLSLCLCGDIMIKLKATNYYCAHCFQTFKGKERVITFCRRRDKCTHYQNGYRLCEQCSNELIKEKIASVNDTDDDDKEEREEEEEEDGYIISQYSVNESRTNLSVDDQKEQQLAVLNTNSSANINIINNQSNEQKEEKEKSAINETVCNRIEHRLKQSIKILGTFVYFFFFWFFDVHQNIGCTVHTHRASSNRGHDEQIKCASVRLAKR